MAKTRFGFFMAILIGVLVVSCSKKNQTAGSDAEVSSIKTSADTLLKNLNNSWYRMIASDDKRLWANERIVKEITSLEGYDSIACKAVFERLAKVKQGRYNQETMGNAGSIDNYDIATDSLWAETKQLMAKHPKIDKYILVADLKNEIAAALDSQVLYRKYYDRDVDTLNNFTQKHAEALKNLGEPYAQLKPKAVFRLVQ